ncbi:YutD family protein [Scopulibacillus cellulosilyticus]|uniref:YutD family protein n=1 Tax=Scopulibacillus cellulosilyticus TaxID=2665665 RepID=A0ABW2PY74_9BACL
MTNPTVSIKTHSYQLIENVKDGWNEEAFLSRYSDILSKYDYIVGDWGYDQLRLRGFYDDFNRKSTFDNKISTLTDYIYEYCNFGCAYFVLQKVKETP